VQDVERPAPFRRLAARLLLETVILREPHVDEGQARVVLYPGAHRFGDIPGVLLPVLLDEFLVLDGHAQLLLDVFPLTGTFSNYYSAVSGREIVTGRDVSGTWDRASNVVWGTVSLAGDTLTVLDAIPTAGASIYENIEIRLARLTRNGSKAAAKLLKLWPKLAKIADRMGGWRRFAGKVAEYIKMDPSKLAKGLRTVEKVGMVAGTVMVVGGAAYHLRYAFVDTKKEIKKRSKKSLPGWPLVRLIM